MTPRTVIITGFVAFLALAITVDLLSRRPRSSIRPLGVTLTAALRTPGGRVAVLGAWFWLGFHFLAR